MAPPITMGPLEHGGKTYYIDLEWLTTPRNGECLVDRWWAFMPDRGVIIHRRDRMWSPQCNSIKTVAESIAGKLYPGATVVLVPAAYLPESDPIPTDTMSLMNQDVWWIDRQGSSHELATMDPRHRANLLPFLVRNALLYNTRCWFDHIRYAPTGHMSDGVADAMDAIEAELGLDPKVWLEQTPLVRRLREYEAQQTILDRGRTNIHNRTYPLRRRMGWTDG